ncbi:eukaryotic translation initiation factor 4e related [Anaeramoeba ignava]|uniref:Eukaryotic translation initiation factor 4e related n=1 Tax=Anaeramoeba ignava TaxID=1746090 RepID=A0A9Q0R9P6_ANAIG|nr:eukaryotic translation initiation factor 4e related [Anaeramoeba ignava]
MLSINRIEVQDSYSLKDEPDEDIDSTLHPLNGSWIFWALPKNRQQTIDWKDRIQKIAECSTVESFWSIYNKIRMPSEIQPGNSLFFFREGIKPEWEDEKNIGGGAWDFQFQIEHNHYKNYFQEELPHDKIWIDLLLGLIGEQFPETELICGIVVTIKPNFIRFSIWTQESENELAQTEIGDHIRKIIVLYQKISSLLYFSHEDRQNQISNRYPKYQIKFK